jgi:hypothetical protein
MKMKTVYEKRIGAIPQAFNEEGASFYTTVKPHVDAVMNIVSDPDFTHLHLLKMHRADCIARMQRLEIEIRELADNKRKKNKTVEMTKLAELQKAAYNARAYDFFLWCVYAHGGDIHFPQTMREGARERLGELQHQTSHMLMMLGQYSGFNFTHWIYGGHDAWRRDGEPERNHNNDEYCRDELGTFFY